MKVLAIYGTEQILGGGEISFTQSLQRVQQHGWQVLAVVPAQGPLAEYLDKSELRYQTAPLAPIRRLCDFRALLSPKAEWLSIALDFRPDLIHCNSIRAALYGQALGHSLRVPTVMHARKSESDGVIDYFLLWRLNAILCTSEIVRRRFPRWFGKGKLKVIHNGVDLGLFQNSGPYAAQLRNKWLDGSEGLLVGAVGRLSPIKGQRLLIQAGPKILSTVAHARFVLIGQEDPCYPGYEKQLRLETRRLGVEDRVIFAGLVDDPAAFYNALDVVVFPTSSEGFGRVIIEAGAARKPLVASNIEVVQEVLSAELSDLTVPAGQSEQLAARIIDLLQSEKLRNDVANRLHERVRKNFGMETHCRRLLGIYNTLIRQERQPQTGESLR